jgi:hypothetical protein
VVTTGPFGRSVSKNPTHSMALPSRSRHDPAVLKAALCSYPHGSGRVASGVIDQQDAAVVAALRSGTRTRRDKPIRGSPSWASIRVPTACGALGRSQRPGAGLGGSSRLGSDGGDQGTGPVAPDPQLTAEGVA